MQVPGPLRPEAQHGHSTPSQACEWQWGVLRATGGLARSFLGCPEQEGGTRVCAGVTEAN